MIGPPVHGPALDTRVLLLGQAPGPREGAIGRPFAWTAGRTLFRWMHEALGVDEATFRARVYIAAVARCFPGKAKGGGDRRPDPSEIATCSIFLTREMDLLRPRVLWPVGTLAIEQVLGARAPLAEVVGRAHRVRWHGVEVDAIPLPHPSGASSWPKVEPGKTLLARALAVLAAHPDVRAAFAERGA